MPDRNNTKLRVLYVAGNGDVAGTLRKWSQQESDRRIMAEAYSAQVYDLASQHGWKLLALPNNEYKGARSGRIAVIPFPKPKSRGIRYYLSEAIYGYRLSSIAKRFGADLVIVSTGLHLLGYLALGVFGPPVVCSRHNTFWARSTPMPKGVVFSACRYACRIAKPLAQAVCVSDEVANQFVKMRMLPRRSVRVFVPQYNLEFLPWCPDNDNDGAKIILFAGRLEESKGVDDVLRAAVELQKNRPGQYEFRIAGDGTYASEINSAVERLGLGESVVLMGRLDRERLSLEVQRCWATITPTRTSFAEGLAKLPIEGAICGKPAIVSQAVPAIDLLGDAAEPTQPGSHASIISAVTHLDDNPDLYTSRQQACSKIRDMVTNEQRGYRHNLECAVDDALSHRG